MRAGWRCWSVEPPSTPRSYPVRRLHLIGVILKNPRASLALLLLVPLASCVLATGAYHRVKAGQTLIQIADEYDADLIEIVLINDLEDPSALKEGQLLYIPRVKEKPAPRDTAKLEKRVLRQEKAPPVSKEALRKTQGRFVWPVKGSLSSEFGVRMDRRHQGLDIAAREGAEFVAADSGKVIYSDNKLAGYGNLIIVKHAGDYASVYAHAERLLVRKGDLVEKGQPIGRVGQTGRATGPHLHFEIRYRNIAHNPLQFLPAM